MKALLSLTLIFATSLCIAAEPDPGIKSALGRAGKNRGEIQKALDQAPPEQRKGMQFLVRYMPVRDLRSLKADYLLENCKYAYKAWNESPWKKAIPEAVFLNNVLPYVSINETRDRWRKDFFNRFGPLVKSAKTPGQAAALLNQKIFPLLKVRFSTKRPKADQSGLETIKAGMASCTGLSVLLVDACRAVGVPARFVGTPLWSDRSGNHSWIEVWDNKDWHFTGAAEPSGMALDRAWFTGRASSAKRDHLLHAIYAVSYKHTPQFFPLVWNRRIGYVRAINVTNRYVQRAKKLPKGFVQVRFQLLDRPDGNRIRAAIRVLDESGKQVFSGKTNDARFDPNDHVSIALAANKKCTVKIEFPGKEIRAQLKVKESKEQLFTLYRSRAVKRSSNRSKLSGEETKFAKSEAGQKIVTASSKFFQTAPAQRGSLQWDGKLDAIVAKHEAVTRKLIWSAYSKGHARKRIDADMKAKRVTYGKLVSPYVVKAVGKKPKKGWPLFIAMHGGGGAPQALNDSQWRHMQIYYRDQKSVAGYLYLAIRAPNNVWNGFYANYNLGLTDNLIKQFVLAGHVDPNRVFIMGYSHGGYGAFFQGRLMPDRFAAVHASAAAPSTIGNNHGKNLRNTVFTYMIGEKDTRYGRAPRCISFNKFMVSIKGKRKDIYPVVMEFKKGYGHGGLPDRDKIKTMYKHVRNPLPKSITWLPDRSEVKSFNWLHVPNPGGGKEINAECKDNQLVVKSTNVDQLHVYLDRRLANYDKPLTIEVNGRKSKVTLKPSLQTMCETLANRGDPEYVFTTRIKLKMK